MGVLFDIYNQKREIRPALIGVSATREYLDIVKGELVDATLLKPILPNVLKETLEKLGVMPAG